ncbi:ubiquitin hydrolase [Trypanosoma rangeli SC58]|uniref:ubiquitinyl hydrolase 1 n=1 Tax=Trypanosoma rangeli SC58 TaxID=429131 RepID=A0A061J2C5_TRYRA|nr:ubiquitin hydrolase [Trypanosoma rangeli SC58]
MSCFQLDAECTYEEFRKTIFHHAEIFSVPDRLPAAHLRVCKEVKEQADKELRAGAFDLAFFHFLRCISIIEKANLDKQSSDVKQLLIKSLDSIEKLDKHELVQYHSKMMQKIRQHEEERKRIVEQQLLPDETEPESFEDKYTRRQQELLMKEKTVVDDVLKRLKDTKIDTPFFKKQKTIEPYWSDSHSELVTVSNNHIAPPRKIPNVSPNAYLVWKFNPGSFSVTSPRRGMVNLGNTCYINSVTQMLSVTPLGAYFLRDDYTKDIVNAPQGELRLVNSFSYVLRELRRTDTATPVSTSYFKDSIDALYSSFQGYSQQDANEFLRVLLDNIHNGLNDRKKLTHEVSDADTTKGSDREISERIWYDYKNQNNSVIVNECAFQERSSLVCPLCHQISRSFTPSLGLEVPIPFIEGQVSIEDCLKAYCKEEILDRDSLYTCPSCKKQVHASKQLLLYSLPRILFLTIKRFRHYGDFSNKIDVPVVFQKKLNMSYFMCLPVKNMVYTLVGVVNHRGNIHGGHYTADCLGVDGVWYSLSDESVSEAEEPNYQLAYILCYVRNG